MSITCYMLKSDKDSFGQYNGKEHAETILRKSNHTECRDQTDQTDQTECRGVESVRINTTRTKARVGQPQHWFMAWCSPAGMATLKAFD